MTKETIITDDDVPQDVIAAVAAGRRVVAIKLLREATGIGLANAKVIVDRLALKHAPPDYSQSAIREDRQSGRLLGLLALLVTAVVGWRFLSDFL